MSPLLLIIGLSCGRLERLSRLYVSDMVPRDDSDSYMLELPQLSGCAAAQLMGVSARLCGRGGAAERRDCLRRTVDLLITNGSEAIRRRARKSRKR